MPFMEMKEFGPFNTSTKSHLKLVGEFLLAVTCNSTKGDCRETHCPRSRSVSDCSTEPARSDTTYPAPLSPKAKGAAGLPRPSSSHASQPGPDMQQYSHQANRRRLPSRPGNVASQGPADVRDQGRTLRPRPAKDDPDESKQATSRSNKGKRKGKRSH